VTRRKDVELLRELAYRIKEIASDPVQEERRRRWYAHNRLERGKPLVFCSPEGSWDELVPEGGLRAEDPLLRRWERELRMRIYSFEHFNDDQVTDDTFKVGYVCTNTGWGAQPEIIRTGEVKGAYRWDPPIKDPEDLDKLHPPELIVDKEATRRNLEIAHDIFDGILEVRLCGRYWWTLGLIGEWSMLRGLEQIMIDMIERPEFMHRAMRFLMEGKLRWLQSLEDRGLLCLNNGNDYVGSGGFGFTDELPAEDFDGEHVRMKDMWGFAEAQEVSGISPAMHDEFVLRYQIPILERFGLNCYGCCEPLHEKFDIVKKIPRLRRISISPWCDRKIAAEELEDKYIYSWKPHPGDIAAVKFNPDKVRAYIRETLEIADGCIVEMVLKDTHTCNNEPWRFDRWVSIAQEEATRFAESKGRPLETATTDLVLDLSAVGYQKAESRHHRFGR